MRRCSICVHRQATAIDAALAAGESIRSVARQFAIPRTTLGRHADHAVPMGSAPALTGPGDQVAAALELLDRSRTERERLRGLESVRRAVRLELKDYSRSRSNLKPPNDAQRASLEANLAEAWAAFEAAKDGRLDLADRALAGVRAAVDAIRSAQAAGGGRMAATVFGHLTDVDRDVVYEWLGIPKAHRTGEYGIRVTPAIGRPPLIEVGNKHGVVWRRRPGDTPTLNQKVRTEPPSGGASG